MAYWGYQVLLVAATRLITASIHFQPDPTNANAILCLIAGMYSFHFFRLIEAIGQALMILAYE